MSKCSLVFTALFSTVLLGSTAHAWMLDKVVGTDAVKIQSHGKTVPSESGLKLTPGLSLTTSAEGKAHLIDGESEIWIAPQTKLTFDREPNDDRDEKGRFTVGAGEIRVHFKQPSGPVTFPYEVKTKSLIASVRGTVFVVSVDGAKETVATIEGLVRVSSAHSAAESWDVPANKGLFVIPKEMPKVRDVAKDQYQKWVDATTL